MHALSDCGSGLQAPCRFLRLSGLCRVILLIVACLQFPNVVDYTLEPLFEVRTDEQHEYLQLLLSRIPVQWPTLERIRFGSAGQKLSWLKSMPDLRMISSTGFSGSTPMETVTILTRLRHLTDLELEWPPRVHTAAGELTNTQIAKFGIKNQSFTRETIKGRTKT